MNHRLRPLGVREIFDLPFFILRERFWSFQGVLFWAFLPAIGIFFLMLLITVLTIWQLAPAGVPWNQELFWSLLALNLKENSTITIIMSIILFLLLMALIVAMAIGYYYFTYASIRLFGSGFHSQPCNYRQAFQGRQGKILQIFLFFLLQGIIAVAASFGFSFLVIFVSMLLPQLGFLFSLLNNLFQIGIAFMFLLSPAIIVLESREVTEAMGRAFKLPKGYRWRTLGVLVLFYILIYLLFAGSFSLVVVLITILVHLKSFWLLLPLTIAILGSLIISSIIICFYNGVLTALYYDLIIRKEGYDLQLRLENQFPSGKT